jgi:rhodanese-related sulfurtransferase
MSMLLQLVKQSKQQQNKAFLPIKKTLSGSFLFLSQIFLKNFDIILINKVKVSVLMNTITPFEVNKLLKEKKVLLIDIREPFEYEIEYIAGSQLIPFEALHIKKFQENKYKKVVLYCRSGKRSRQAAEYLLRQMEVAHSFFDLAILAGGLSQWKEEKMPVVEQGLFSWSLESQTQILTGSMTLLGLLLGSILQSEWYLLAVLSGSIELISGLTTYRLLYYVLGFLPWNRSARMLQDY